MLLPTRSPGFFGFNRSSDFPGVAAVTPWTPTALGSALKGWWDASDLTTLWQDSARTTPVTADADPVGAWDDKAATLGPWIQATAGSRPSYKTAIQGGKPIIRNASTKTMAIASITLAQPLTLVTVHAIAAKGAANRFLIGHSSHANIYCHTDRFALYAGTTQVDVCDFDIAFHVHVAGFNGASSTYALDGVPGSVVGNPGAAGWAAASIGIFHDPAGGGNLAVDIAEILAISGLLSAVDFSGLATYIHNKWGTPSNSDFVIFEGDSITDTGQTQIGVCYPTVAAQAISPIPANQILAINGSTIATMSARAAVTDAIFAAATIPTKKVLCVMIGRNDVVALGAATYTANLKTYCLARRAATSGLKIVLVPILPSTLGGFNVVRNAANVLVAADPSFYDALVAQDATMWADAAASDVSLYFDGTHPTTLGQQDIAPFVQTALASLL